MEDLINKLNMEKLALLGKIKRIEEFRGTEEWDKLSTNHKCLLDVQIQAMRTYLECLSARTCDLCAMIEKESEQTEEEQNIKIVKIIIDNS